jgi:hypothetical protein
MSLESDFSPPAMSVHLLTFASMGEQRILPIFKLEMLTCLQNRQCGILCWTRRRYCISDGTHEPSHGKSNSHCHSDLRVSPWSPQLVPQNNSNLARHHRLWRFRRASKERHRISVHISCVDGQRDRSSHNCNWTSPRRWCEP